MNVGSSHFALGTFFTGHPRVGNDFLPLAVLVEPVIRPDAQNNGGYHKPS